MLKYQPSIKERLRSSYFKKQYGAPCVKNLYLNHNIMKHTLKSSLVALTVVCSIAACKGNKSSGSADSAKNDTTTTVKKTADTSIIVDSVKPATDTSKAKMDTVSKVIKTTEVKKSSVKKKDKE